MPSDNLGRLSKGALEEGKAGAWEVQLPFCSVGSTSLQVQEQKKWTLIRQNSHNYYLVPAALKSLLNLGFLQPSP